MPRGGPELPDRPQRKASARRRAAEQRDELATLHRRNHSITSSARATNVGGMVRPSARAVCRLMTNSNLVGCWTGKWDGSAPLSILSTKPTARRNKSPLEAPYVISPQPRQTPAAHRPRASGCQHKNLQSALND